jgi:hypothetical protein
MKRIIAIIVTIGSLTAIGQQAPKPPEPAKPAEKKVPVLSDKVQKDFFKAKSDLQAAGDEARQAQQNIQQKQQAFQAVVGEVNKACGDAFTAQIEARSGDLQCVAKPPEPEKKSGDQPPVKH